jgi:hypothetical protein
LLSTVILLGGFVSSLGKKDFFCITVITVIEAAGSVTSFYLISLYPCSLQVFPRRDLPITSHHNSFKHTPSFGRCMLFMYFTNWLRVIESREWKFGGRGL